MTKTFSRFLPLVVAIVIGIGGLIAGRSVSGETLSLSELVQETHFHGIAVDPKDPTQLYLATHHGFFAVTSEGEATRLSENTDDFMGFTPHPADPSIFFASGHPAQGGNLGVIASTDGGRTWRQLSGGVNGPVDFHQMDVSRADPKTMYGVHGGLQISTDGGESWSMVGPAPEGLIDLAASAMDPETLYAGTKTGLFRSRDRGRTWQDAGVAGRPVTMVQATADGEVYAFVAGLGLIRAREPGLDWRTLNDRFGDDYVLHLAADPTDEAKLYVITYNHGILASQDGGRTWAALGSG